jgi:hypothetical protein
METRKQKKPAPMVDPKTGEITEVVFKVAKDLVENTLKAKVFPFELQQLVMKNEQWEMHTMIVKTLNSVSKNYNLTLVVNLEPIDEKIDLASKRIAKGQIRLDGSSQAQEEHEALLNTKQELIDNCPDILIKASVLRTKYFPAKGTQVVFWIPSEIINELNSRRNYIEHYNLKMEQITLAS